MITKKVAIIGLCAALVVAAATSAVVILVQKKHDDHIHNYINKSQKAIQDLCQNTYYQKTCIDSLSKASNSSDTKTLIGAGFQSAIKELNHVINQTHFLQEASKDPQTVEAYKTCRKLLDDSIHDLQRTIQQVNSFDMANFKMLIDDIKTWLTGALTYQETCMDCFHDVKGDAGEKMEKLLNLSRELTINGLAMANEFSGLLAPNEQGNGRRLLAEKPDLIDYDYGYDYRGKFPQLNNTKIKGKGRRLLVQKPDLIDYDYGYDYRGKAPILNNTNVKGKGRRLLVQKPDLIDYDYGYDYRGKPPLLNYTTGNGKGRRLLADGGTINPNVIVAKDGSGKYKTINEALLDVPMKSNETFVIYIKEGVYEEYVTVNKTMWSVMFIGDGPTKTRITGNRSKIGGWETFWTATVAIEGDNFIAKDIGFENTAGPDTHQAVALRVSPDKTIFHNCQIDGFQDTLYAHNHRQFYRDCTISGTIDFIFGNARAVLQNCTLLIKKPLESQKLCMLTAQGRTQVNQTSAVVLENCRVLPGPDYPVEDKSYRAYLGRPWKEFSRTIVMDSQIEGLIVPEGWSSWNGTSAHLDTCWYAEVSNKGPGADLSGRVKWPGIKSISIEEALAFTPGEYMLGDAWIAGNGLPYDSGRMANY